MREVNSELVRMLGMECFPQTVNPLKTLRRIYPEYEWIGGSGSPTLPTSVSFELIVEYRPIPMMKDHWHEKQKFFIQWELIQLTDKQKLQNELHDLQFEIEDLRLHEEAAEKFVDFRQYQFVIEQLEEKIEAIEEKLQSI